MTGYENTAAEFEEFLDDIQTRHLYNTLSNDDPTPGKAWSRACNESWFLLAMQNMPRDSLMKIENKLYWQFLHVGSDEPN